jgi:hypothetical protein
MKNGDGAKFANFASSPFFISLSLDKPQPMNYHSLMNTYSLFDTLKRRPPLSAIMEQAKGGERDL